MICGNCRSGFDPENNPPLLQATKCTACKYELTKGHRWIYCEECGLDLGCCESCGDMLYEPRRPDLAQDLGLTPYFQSPNNNDQR